MPAEKTEAEVKFAEGSEFGFGRVWFQKLLKDHMVRLRGAEHWSRECERLGCQVYGPCRKRPDGREHVARPRTCSANLSDISSMHSLAPRAGTELVVSCGRQTGN